MTLPLWWVILASILIPLAAYAGWNYIRIFYGKDYDEQMKLDYKIFNIYMTEGYGGVRKFMDENPELVKKLNQIKPKD